MTERFFAGCWLGYGYGDWFGAATGLERIGTVGKGRYADLTGRGQGERDGRRKGEGPGAAGDGVDGAGGGRNPFNGGAGGGGEAVADLDWDGRRRVGHRYPFVRIVRQNCAARMDKSIRAEAELDRLMATCADAPALSRQRWSRPSWPRWRRFG